MASTKTRKMIPGFDTRRRDPNNRDPNEEVYPKKPEPAGKSVTVRSRDLGAARFPPGIVIYDDTLSDHIASLEATKALIAKYGITCIDVATQLPYRLDSQALFESTQTDAENALDRLVKEKLEELHIALEAFPGTAALQVTIDDKGVTIRRIPPEELYDLDD